MNKESTRQRRYDEKNCRRFQLKLNTGTDKEVIERLESCYSMQGYIKALIRKDIDEGNDKFQAFGIINQNIDHLELEDSYEYIYKSHSIGNILRKLDELDAGEDYTIEIFWETEEGEFIMGSDFDTVENFRKRASEYIIW